VIIDHKYFHVSDPLCIYEHNTSFPGLKHPLPRLGQTKKAPDKQALSGKHGSLLRSQRQYVGLITRPSSQQQNVSGRHEG